MMTTLRRLAARLLGRVYRHYYATLDVRALMPDGTTKTAMTYPFGPEIVALCERDILAVAGLTARLGVTVLVANGRDGDWATAALEALGCHVVRGSSLRGGTAALLTMTDALTASERPAAMVVDGPLGPSGHAKPGAAMCARRTGRPLRALGVAARRRVEFAGTWSRIYLPLPFTNVRVVCGAHEYVPPDCDRTGIDAVTARLSAHLSAARDRALHLVHEVGA